jgi:hypothetical protein
MSYGLVRFCAFAESCTMGFLRFAQQMLIGISIMALFGAGMLSNGYLFVAALLGFVASVLLWVILDVSGANGGNADEQFEKGMNVFVVLFVIAVLVSLVVFLPKPRPPSSDWQETPANRFAWVGK